MALDKFPVDESALPRVTISAKRLEEWKEVAHEEIQRALSNRHSWYNSFKEKIRDGYDMLADRPNLKAFVRPVPNSNDKDLLIRSTFDNVTLDDIAYGVYSETSYEVRCAFAHMYEENFLDAGILHVHETRTPEDPLHFVGLRWVAFRSPAPKIVTSRDFVFFSYEGTMLDVKGERVIFRFLRTMPMEDVPVDSSKLPPLVRGKISNLHFYRQNGAHVEAYVKAMHSNAGSMPSYVVTKTIAFMYPGVTNMETIGDARALMNQGLTRLNPSRESAKSNASMSSNGSNPLSQSGGPRAPTSLASANACGVCYHKFKMTRSKRQCHGCSRMVCKRCTRAMWFFDEQKQMSSTGVVRLRFCHNCTRHARSESSMSRSSLETPKMARTNPGETGRSVHMDGSRGGSGGSSHSLHRVSSQDSIARTPSNDGSQYSFQQRTPRQDGSLPRVPSQDSMYQKSLHRVPSHDSMYSGGMSRGMSHSSQGGSGSRIHSQVSMASSQYSKSSHTQPEAEFSDNEIFDDELLDLHDGSFIHPTQSPPNKPLASSKIMSFKSSSSSHPFSSSQVSGGSTSTFNSSQVSGGSTSTFNSSQVNAFNSSQVNGGSTSTFNSSQVKIAFEGSPVNTTSAFESSHVGQYAGMGFAVKQAAGDSEEEDADEDFGDFHDSDSDVDDIDGSNDHDEDFDLDNIGGIVNHDGLHDNLRDTNDDFSDAYSVIDSDDYSIAGSFSYEGGPQSFMSDLGSESFSFDVDDHSSRGSFVPLTLVDKPSVVAQQFNSRPMMAPVPQLTQRRLPPHQPATLRNYPPPATLDETSEMDSSAPMPPIAHTLRTAPKPTSRTNSTPNLLAYGATKRTNRPGGAGMAPVRRAISGSGAGVIVNGVNHAVQSPASRPHQPYGGDDLANDFESRVHVHSPNAAAAGGNSPMVRYYGS